MRNDNKSGMTTFLRSMLGAWIVAAVLHGLPDVARAQDVVFPGARRFPVPPANPQNRQSCFPHDSCQVRGNSRDMITMDRKHCYCDQACAEYGDCCQDSRFYTPESAAAALNVWKCSNQRNYFGIYQKAACPPWWNDTEIRQMCESTREDDEDPFQKLLFTSRTSQFTYKNYYCALCNQDIASPIFWLPHLECGDRPIESPFNTTEEFWDHIKYNRSLQSWGVNGPNGSFISCTIDSEMPQMVEDMVRRCTPFVYTCASNWTNFRVRERCTTYTTYVYEGYFTYRNWDCAKCNYAESPTCAKIETRYNAPTFNPNIFTVLFDVNAQNGQRVGEIKICADSEVYDPFFRRCRSIICGRPDEIYRQGRCISVDGSSTQSPTEMPTESNGIDNSTFPSTDDKKTQWTITKKLNQTTTMADVAIFPGDENTLYNTSSQSSGETNQTSEATSQLKPMTEPSVPFIDTSEQNNTIDHESEETDSETNTTSISVNQNGSSTIKPKEDSTETAIATAEGKDGKPSHKTTTDLQKEASSNPTTPTRVEIPSSTKTPEIQTELSGTTESSETTSKFLNCEKVELNADEFEILDNGSIYVEVYNRVLMNNEYHQKENNVLVCAQNVLGSDYSNYIHKFSSYLAIVALIGLGISLLCLVLHLAAFSLVSDLRNLSGNNLASLCVALILAYTMFILAQFNSTPSTFCTVIGVVMCYSFLSSFFWMNTMAFDVWRALRQATTELRISSGQQWRKFFVYSAYSWLSPLLIVISALVIENIPSIPEDLRPAFGQRLCWFNHRRALLLFFVVPIVTIIIINILLFSLSAYMIVSTTHSSAKFHNHKTQRTFRLYLRLALLMGLTWVVGIVAAAADVDPLWYVFVAFNTLQGLFIFFAFTCNKKVLQSVAARIPGRSRLSRKSSMFVDSCSGARLTQKNGLEARDSADSHSSQTSRSSLTQTTTVRSSSVDTLY